MVGSANVIGLDTEIYWRNSFSCGADDNSGLVSDGLELGEAFSELSSSSQSCDLVEPGSQPNFVGAID